MEDLIAEHAALIKERAALSQAILAEWQTMSHNVAKERQARMWEITDRLAAIERTKTWHNRP